MTRTTSILLVVAVTAVAAGDVPSLVLPPFSAHMVSHMSLVAIAAPLFAWSLAGSPWDPVRSAPRYWSPIVASMIELLLVWGWHAPALHHSARHVPWVRSVEHASFFASGAFLWLCVLGGGASLRRERLAESVGALLLTSMHMTLLGALMTLTPRLLYHSHGGLHPWVSPIHDQQLGGAVMLLLGNATYLGVAVALMGGVLQRRARVEP